MRKLTVLTLAAAILTAAACVAAQTVYAKEIYVYGDISQPAVDISPGLVRSTNSVSEAVYKMEELLKTLDGAKTSDPNVLDQLALLTETLARRGVTVDIDEDKPLTVGMIRQQAEAVKVSLTTLELLAGKYNFNFQREIRSGVTFQYKERVSAQFESGLNATGIERITLETDYASLTLDVSDVAEAADIRMRRASDIDAPEVDVLSIMLRYWSVAGVFVVTMGWLFAMALIKKRIPWWIPVMGCAALIGVNLALEGLPSAPVPVQAIADDKAVTVQIDGVASAVLSIPTDEPRPNEIVIVDAEGSPIACKYNRVTGTIDGRIYENGTYTLKLSPAYFKDVDDKSEEMKLAIYTLTSRGLMATPDDRYFLPDREITRAEFLAVILNSFHLMDAEAENPFPDVLPRDWFYSVAASAYKENLIGGYEDGTFRGNAAMPKEQMVAIAANCLTGVMRYKSAERAPLSELYGDADQISQWAENSVMMAVKAGIVPERADGLFAPASEMTRGDAAVMLYRLFMRLW